MVFCINDGWYEAAAFCTMNGKNCSFFCVSICRSYSLLKMNKSQKGIIFLINNVTVTKQYFSDDCLLCLYEGSAVHLCLESDVNGFSFWKFWKLLMWLQAFGRQAVHIPLGLTHWASGGWRVEPEQTLRRRSSLWAMSTFDWPPSNTPIIFTPPRLMTFSIPI